MRGGEREFLHDHSAHDPLAIVERWRRVADRASLRFSPFARAGEHDLFCLRSHDPPRAACRVYLSAGVHGDEPGAALGLLYWAEQNLECLRSIDIRIFPLWNPWGIANNSRADERGRDLNRLFHSRAYPFPAWRRELGRRPFDLAVCLHEDFDARGCYIYELGAAGLAERLLAEAAAHIGPDPRSEIEDMAAVSGVIRPEAISREDFPLEGLPEAVWLYFERCPVSLTLETPSEFSLYDRVHANAAMLSAAISASR